MIALLEDFHSIFPILNLLLFNTIIGFVTPCYNLQVVFICKCFYNEVEIINKRKYSFWRKTIK